LSLAFDVERDTAQTLLPEKFGTATGRAYGHCCEWQACADRGSELVDPVCAQYKEFFILIEAESGLSARAASAARGKPVQLRAYSLGRNTLS